MYKLSKVHAVLLACGLLLIFFVGFVEDPNAPDRTLNNDLLNGCFQGSGIFVTISHGHNLKIAEGPSALIGNLSEIKSADYVHLTWDKSVAQYPLNLDGYADINRKGNTVESLTFIVLPDQERVLKRTSCV